MSSLTTGIHAASQSGCVASSSGGGLVRGISWCDWLHPRSPSFGAIALLLGVNPGLDFRLDCDGAFGLDWEVDDARLIWVCPAGWTRMLPAIKQRSNPKLVPHSGFEHNVSQS